MAVTKKAATKKEALKGLDMYVLFDNMEGGFFLFIRKPAVRRERRNQDPCYTCGMKKDSPTYQYSWLEAGDEDPFYICESEGVRIFGKMKDFDTSGELKKVRVTASVSGK